MDISDKETFVEVEVHVQSTKEASKRTKLPKSTIRNALDEILDLQFKLHLRSSAFHVQHCLVAIEIIVSAKKEERVRTESVSN